MTRKKAVEVKNPDKKVIKKKDVWKIFGLVTRMNELILDGTLKSQGLDKIYEIIRSEFAGELKKPEYNLDKRMFSRKVNELIWSPKIIAQLKDAVRNHYSLEDHYRLVSYIPRDMYDRKCVQLRGKAKNGEATDFVRGILRLGEEISQMSGDPVRFESGTFTNPFIAEFPSDTRSVMILNGINLGVPYSGVLGENPSRLALENAQHHGDPIIILTNFLDADPKKAGGPQRVAKALMSGRNVNPADLDSRYKAEVERILRDQPHDEIIYQTTAELFVESLRALSKLWGSDKKPIFTGRVLVVLGYKDEEIITAAAYWEATYLTRRKQAELLGRLRAVTHQIATRREHGLSTDYLDIEQRKISDMLSRTNITNITTQDWKRYYNKVLRFFVAKIEQTIPNSRVVGIGTSYIKIGNSMIEVNIPRHNNPTDELLSDYCSSHGPKVLRERMARCVVICHPNSPNYRMTVREVDQDGVRGCAQIFVCPIAVDEKYIRTRMRDIIDPVHKLSRTVLSEQFKAGVLRLIDVDGIFQPSVWSVEALQSFHEKIRESRTRGVHIGDSKYIWIMVETDLHIGSPAREILLAPDGRMMGMGEAVIEQMQRDGLFEDARMPVHMISFNDDPTQGNHFGFHKQPSPQKMSYTEFQRSISELINRAKLVEDVDEIRSLLARAAKLSQSQILLRGEPWVQDQVEMMINTLIKPYVGFFDAILRRTIRSKIQIRGVSHFSGSEVDRRDIGAINFGTGNHYLKSVDLATTEGFIYAGLLRAYLSALPYWAQNPDLLEQLVRSPLYSNQFIGLGTIVAPGGYEYFLDLRDTPPGRGVNWNDPLQVVVRNDTQRGNYSRIANGRYGLKLYGDKHFFATVVTGHSLYVMSAPDTHTDLFGELGFPPNNTGVSFIGLPVDGPQSAPILVRALSFDYFKNVFENDGSIDWEVFLPRPV